MRKTTMALLMAAVVWAPAVRAEPAAPAAPAAPEASDPAESFNRVGYAIFEALDHAIIRPVAMVYLHVTPKPLRTGIEHILANLHQPVVMANDLFQGRFNKAGISGFRFLTNSTVGVLGLFDVATKVGLPAHDNSFALTLGRSGVRPGPYLFFPILGPTTVRDAVGTIIDGLTDPFNWIVPHGWSAASGGRIVVGGINSRANADAQLTAVLADATDPYATLRSVYLQNQQAKIDDTNPNALPALPSFDDDTTPGAAHAPAPGADLTIDGPLVHSHNAVEDVSAASDAAPTTAGAVEARLIAEGGLGDTPVRTAHADYDARYQAIQARIAAAAQADPPEQLLADRDPPTVVAARATPGGG